MNCPLTLDALEEVDFSDPVIEFDFSTLPSTARRAYDPAERREYHNIVSSYDRMRRFHPHALCRWADKEAMAAFYREAAQQTAATGTPWVVDHQVPLRSKYVCGLHNEHNLQAIPESWNMFKSNLYWPDQ